MYCKHCGKEIDDKAVMCVHCGKILSNHYAPAVARVRSNYKPISGLILSFLTIFVPIFSIVGFITSIMQYQRAKNVGAETNYAKAGIYFSAFFLILYTIQFLVGFRVAAWELSNQLIITFACLL